MTKQIQLRSIVTLLVTLLVSIGIRPAWSGEKPVGHWLFQQDHAKENRIVNDAGEGDLQVTGGIRFRTEGERTAMIVDRDRHDARVSISGDSLLLPKQALTVEAMIAIEKTVEWGGILSAVNGQKGWLLGFRQSNFSFVVATDDSGLTIARSPDSLDWGKWYHVVGTYDGKNARIYVNGRLEDEKPASGQIVYSGPTDIRFGTYIEDSTEFRARLWFHEAAIYDRALTPEEIAAKFEKKKTLIPRELHVRVGPYLERIDRDTIIARWETEHPSPTVLVYGQEIPVTERVEDLTPKTKHEIAIDGLEKQKMYYYRIEFTGPDGKTFSTRLHELDTTFDYAPVETRLKEGIYASDSGTAEFAQAVLDRAGIDRGYCIVLGVGDGSLAYELAKRSNLKVFCIDPDSSKVQAARRKLDEAGLYGVRVSVKNIEGEALPLAPFLANILIVDRDNLDGGIPYSPGEILKIVRPEGGVAYLPKDHAMTSQVQENPEFTVDTDGKLWAVAERKPLEGIGAWTHQYGDAGNTSSSHDKRVAGHLDVLWYGEPGPRPMTDRGTRSPAPLSLHGRLFVQGDRRLFGLDSYNGTLLWDREIPDMRRANVPRDCSNMMAKGDFLWVAIRDRLWKIDGQTGNLVTTFPVRVPDSGLPYDWGYIADGGNLLLGSAVRHGGLYIGADGEWYDKPNQESEKVTSDNLFGIDPESGEVRWVYENGRIVNPTLAAGDGSVFFIETRAPEALASRSARLRDDVLFKDQYLVCLDADTGKVRWERPAEFEGGNWVLYLSYYDGVISVLATTKDFHLHTFDAKTGEPLWEHHNKMRRDHHGGGMQHPVLTRGNIYSDSLAFDIRTGQIVHDNLPERRGCGTMSAAENAIFFRHYFHSIWDLDTDERIQYEGLRSGCWLGIIPAGGILLAPESSSGCYCGDPIQTSIAFLPGSLLSEK